MQQRRTSDLLSLLFLLLMCGGIVVSVVFYRKLQQSNRQLIENAQTIDSLNTRLTSANQEILSMLHERDSIAKQQATHPGPTGADTLIPGSNIPKKTPVKSTEGGPKDGLSAKPLTDILQKALAIENGVFDITVYAYNCPANTLPQAYNYFTANGYHTLDTATLEMRPSWFAAQSTVFYYSEKNKQRAAGLAAGLRQKTGFPVNTQRGAGLGVAKGAEDYTFKVHLIR